jgi:hypothetical protein
MPLLPSDTDIEPQLTVLQSQVADEGRHWQDPDTTTLTTPRSPKPPVPRTTANDVTDAIVTAGDPEFARKVWAYIRNQLLRLRGANVQ